MKKLNIDLFSKTWWSRALASVAIVVLLPTATALEEGQVAALDGLKRLEKAFGRAAISQITEMTGVAGVPQPEEWRVTARDLRRADILHEFWIGENRVTDEGTNDDFYPDKLPKGFFKLSRVKLDSTQAFAMAEQVAREAKIGFDLINYKLHCREYSDEPVWTLTLLDRHDDIVGSVHLSAESGELLRTVWMRRRPNGRLVVEDSAQGARPRPLAAAAPTTPPSRPAGLPDTPPPPPSEPDAEEAPESATRTADEESADAEIPEIEKLNEAQEKALAPQTPTPPPTAPGQ